MNKSCVKGIDQWKRKECYEEKSPVIVSHACLLLPSSSKPPSASSGLILSPVSSLSGHLLLHNYFANHLKGLFMHMPRFVNSLFLFLCLPCLKRRDCKERKFPNETDEEGNPDSSFIPLMMEQTERSYEGKESICPAVKMLHPKIRGGEKKETERKREPEGLLSLVLYDLD